MIYGLKEGQESKMTENRKKKRKLKGKMDVSFVKYDDLAQRPCPWWPFSPFWCCDGDDLPAGCSGNLNH